MTSRMRRTWLDDEEYQVILKMRRERRDIAYAKAQEQRQKRYTFADLRPDAQEAHRHFQVVFGTHFPYLLEDEHRTIVECEWIYNSIFGNPMETVKKSGLGQEFKKLRKAVRTVAEHPTGYLMAMLGSFDEGNDVDAGAKAIFDFLLDVSDMMPPHNSPVPLAKALDRYEALAREAINRTPDRRNIKWDAVHAVYRLRVLWWRNTGEDAPRRALNPESPFANYLRDAFDYLEIKGDPVSAFRRWATLADEDNRYL